MNIINRECFHERKTYLQVLKDVLTNKAGIVGHYDLARAKIILGFWVQKLHNAN